MNTNVYNYTFKKFSRSQDKWECDLNLTYPPIRHPRIKFGYLNIHD